MLWWGWAPMTHGRPVGTHMTSFYFTGQRGPRGPIRHVGSLLGWPTSLLLVVDPHGVHGVVHRAAHVRWGRMVAPASWARVARVVAHHSRVHAWMGRRVGPRMTSHQVGTMRATHVMWVHGSALAFATHHVRRVTVRGSRGSSMMGTGGTWVGPTTHRPHVGLAMVEGLRRLLLMLVVLWESSIKTLVFLKF